MNEIQLSSLPEPSSTLDFTLDSNMSCTWLEYASQKFSYVFLDNFATREQAMRTCIGLGKNKCNAVIMHQLGCWRCPPRYHTILASGQPNPNSG